MTIRVKMNPDQNITAQVHSIDTGESFQHFRKGNAIGQAASGFKTLIDAFKLLEQQYPGKIKYITQRGENISINAVLAELETRRNNIFCCSGERK